MLGMSTETHPPHEYDALPYKVRVANIVIDRIGGTSATARLCEVQPPSVSGWRKDGLPRPQEKYLRLARPDVFEGLDEAGDPAPDASPGVLPS